MLDTFDMAQLPYFILLFGVVLGAVLLAVLKFRRPGRDKETLRLELVLSEAQRQIKALQSNPKSPAFERVRTLLREVQVRLYSLPPDLTARYENRVMKVLQEAARVGITVSPEQILQHR